LRLQLVLNPTQDCRADEECASRSERDQETHAVCVLTSEITGAHEQAPLRGAMHLGVRVD
jgi:hypothetical protein